jgi:shikimate kinase
VLPGIDHIVVVGLMGAGKSTVGRALAERLGWPWLDSDTEIEHATGQTVRELRDAEGVDAMHAREADQLLAALGRDGPLVESAAASIADAEACLDALRRPGVAVVWLRVTPAALAARFAGEAHRPSYGDDPETFLADQMATRGPRFASVDPVIVDENGMTPDQVTDLALRGLQERVARG